MKRAACLALLAWPSWCHVLSMSSGDLTVTGDRAHYELRMPLYEIAHTRAPERSLLEHIRFHGAAMVSKSCAIDAARDLYICEADYQFAAPVERVEVDCDLYAVTVPNHVHLLRAMMGGRRDQGIFDYSFTRATLRFRPPTPAEIAFTQSGEGFLRAVGGIVQILFLAALALAARSRTELLALTGMFLTGQIAGVMIVPHVAWQPAPRFVEAAAALAIAYLAVEILLLPQAGARWLVAGVLGLFPGLYFHLFIQNTGYSPGLVLSGAGLAEVVAIAVFGVVRSFIGRAATQVCAGGLLLFGMGWFFLRLRG